MKHGIFVFALVAAITCGAFGIVAGEEPVLQLPWEDGFEAGEAALPPGWTVFSGETQTRTTEAAHTGKYSFRIEDRLPAGGIGLRSPLVPVAPGQEYTATAWVLTKEGNASFYIEFWDETKKTRLVPISVTVKYSAAGEWQQAVVKNVAPDNARYASVILYSVSTNQGVSYFDDVRLSVSGK